MVDFAQGIKKDVSEIKFLIHDLRVERFIDELIHYYVALDTDLELHAIDPRPLTADDVHGLRSRAAVLRAGHEEYAAAVRSGAGPEEVLAAADRYVATIHELCEVVLNPLWSQIDGALALLPEQAHSVRARNHYRNVIRWLCGVYNRIEHFWAEQRHEDVYEVFDVAEDLADYVGNVVHGYVAQLSEGRVELRLGRLEPAVLGGNRHRFRRMYFNLIMNAVDAMADKKVGVVTVEDRVVDGGVEVTVRDDGRGMSAQKVEQLLEDRQTLDGELHSLGFVFVRQTIDEFDGRLSIESAEGRGTTVRFTMPILDGVDVSPSRRLVCAEYEVPGPAGGLVAPVAPERDAPGAPGTIRRPGHADTGRRIVADYESSDADYPGCIFAIAVGEDGGVELFAHRPYERFWNVGHEDLLPMFFEATVRGRLEADEDYGPALILKPPQNRSEYFDLKEVPAAERTPALFIGMVHDELIRIARRLVATGLPDSTVVQVAGLPQFLPEVGEPEPFPVRVLAGQVTAADA